MLKLLEGRAKGLDGRSEALSIWLGRRTNKPVFSGDREPGLVGDSPALAFVGDVLGIVPRAVAGDALFWRRKGDWRALGFSKGDGREA